MADEADLANDAIERENAMREAARTARTALHIAPSAEFCVECGNGIAQGRRDALGGVQTCIYCASKAEGRRHG